MADLAPLRTWTERMSLHTLYDILYWHILTRAWKGWIFGSPLEPTSHLVNILYQTPSRFAPLKIVVKD
jgi:hypothetical protein